MNTLDFPSTIVNMTIFDKYTVREVLIKTFMNK